MVKLSLKGAQDPTDPSLQMKVLIKIILRFDSISSLDAKLPPKKSPTPRSMLSDFLLSTKSSPKPNSGTISVVNSKPKELKDKSSALMKSLREDPIMSKLSVLS